MAASATDLLLLLTTIIYHRATRIRKLLIISGTGTFVFRQQETLLASNDSADSRRAS